MSFHLVNIALAAAIFIFGFLYLSHPYAPQLILYLSISAALLVIRLWFAALTRISRSNIHDGIKLCWTLLVILLPIIGSVSALIVVNE